MAITIGRIGWTPAPLNPTTITRRADRLSMSGTFVTTSPTFARLAASQIPALLAPDEPIVPVLFGENADLNGFYRVVGADVDLAPDAIDNGHVRWGIDLEPVPDRPAPQVEHILDTVLRSNSVSILAASADPWHAVPTSIGVYYDGLSNVLETAPFTTATGSIDIGQSTTETPPYRRIARTVVRPEHWYRGAATVERLWGTDWLPLAGRDIHAVDPTGLVGITNGIVRARLHPTDNTKLLFSCWDGSWESETEVRFEIYANPPYSPTRYVTVQSFTVVRNTPEEVRVRITGGSVLPQSTIDLRLRRGSPLVEMRWSMLGAADNFGRPNLLDLSPSPTWSNISGGGGRIRSSADASGNKIVQTFPIGSTAGSPPTVSTWTTALGFQTAAAATFADVFAEAQIRNGYFAATAELQRVVGA